MSNETVNMSLEKAMEVAKSINAKYQAGKDIEKIAFASDLDILNIVGGEMAFKVAKGISNLITDTILEDPNYSIALKILEENRASNPEAGKIADSVYANDPKLRELYDL